MAERKLFKFYKSYYDVACELADKDRLAFYDAIMQRQFLGIEPKLKGIAKLAYVSQKYNIDAQVKGWEDRMNKKLIDNQLITYPAQGGISGGISGGIQGGGIQEEVEEKEKEKVKEEVEVKRNIDTIKSFDFKKQFLDLGVEAKILEDWLKVRKTKKAVNSETAFNGIKKKMEASGKSFNECVTISAEKSWAGFDIEWLKDKQTKYNNSANITKLKGEIVYEQF